MDSLSHADGHVKFLDDYNQENSAIYRKLQSKLEALKIMRKELEKFRQERDQFKLMAETLQIRYSAIKKSLNSNDYSNIDCADRSNVAALVNETREKNISLTTEVEILRQKLTEMQGDIQVLRNKNNLLINAGKCLKNGESNDKEKEWIEEKSKFIVQLETLKKKNAQLQYDFRALLDEKEEIVTERDAYKCKVHRLNHELNVALKGEQTENKVLDIDGLILENKYLQDRLKNLESELELGQQSLLKYKNMLETKRKKGIIKLGTNNSDMIMSHKQVKNLLERGTLSEIPLNSATISDLKSLCLTLLDNLNDKNLALTHQKKANKILASRILALSSISPSETLLKNYTASTVDQEQVLSTHSHNIDEDSGTAESSEGSKIIDSIDHLSIEELNKSNISEEYDGVYADSYTSSEYTIENNNSTEQLEEDLPQLPPFLAEMVENALKEINLENNDEDEEKNN